jgi:acyl-homoserine-lactone acylase
LATAVQRLRDAGVAFDARLGDIQFVTRNGERIPIPGGTNASGLLNIIGAPFSASGGGYPNVTSGSSWIQATEFTGDGPVSRGIMTYSQSINPGSPHSCGHDQALLAGASGSIFRSTRGDVAAATLSSLHLVRGQG